MVLTRPLDEVVDRYIFSGTPYVFRENPDDLQKLRAHLASAIKLEAERIIVVGSAMLGFSLNPENFPRQFSDESDVDVVVINDALFDRIWATILRWHYPRRLTMLGKVDGEWAQTRRKDIYWGWFVPDAIRYEGLSLPDVLKPLRDLSAAWFDAFKSLSLYPEFARRNVSGRLYRTWDHARLYHVDGLRQIQEIVRSMQKG